MICYKHQPQGSYSHTLPPVSLSISLSLTHLWSTWDHTTLYLLPFFHLVPQKSPLLVQTVASVSRALGIALMCYYLKGLVTESPLPPMME